MSKSSRGCLCSVGAVLVAVACSGGGALPGVVVTDSAGVEIVSNSATLIRSSWTVDSTPMLQIGVLDGPPEYVLSGVAGAVRLTDGRVAIGDGGSASVRIYAADGRFLREFGRAGNGPGEFASLDLSRIGGDTLLITDVTNRRFSVLDPEHGFLRFMSFPASMPAADVRGVAGGAAVAWRLDSVQPRTAGWDSLSIVTINLRTEEVREIRRAPFVLRDAAAPIERTALLTAAHDGFWYGQGETFEVRQYSASGAVVRLVRLGSGPDGTPAPPGQFLGSMVDLDGNLWIWMLEEGSPPYWHVFSPAGHYLSKVELPSGFLPYEIGPDYVLTRHWDAFDVEYVRLYRLSKSP